MKRERNSFFNESGYNNGYFYSGNNYPMMPNMESSSSFYMNQSFNDNPSSYNDFQTRLSRLERQVNKLEARVNKLENYPTNNISETTEINSSSNMYMI